MTEPKEGGAALWGGGGEGRRMLLGAVGVATLGPSVRAVQGPWVPVTRRPAPC